MIGNNKVFVFGDGTMSTQNLQHRDGNRYTLLHDEDAQQAQTECDDMNVMHTMPYDTGEMTMTTTPSEEEQESGVNVVSGDLVKSSKPALFLLVETHCRFDSVASFWRSVGYELCGCSEAIGHRGGIWVLAPVDRTFVVQIMDVHPQEHLTTLRQQVLQPWLAAGDFNEIMSPSEVSGGDFCQMRANRMLAMVEECEFIDFGATGRQFTWERKHNGRRTIAKRLDRSIGDVSWYHNFPEAYVEHLARVYSDHCPILVRCNDPTGDHVNRPFRFLAAWSTHPSFEPLICDTWKEPPSSLKGKLDNIRVASLAFNTNVFGNITRRKKIVERRLQGLQHELEVGETESLLRLEKDLQEEYEQIFTQEELTWYQKSRERWVKFGDQNTKFFHLQTVVCRNRVMDIMPTTISVEDRMDLIQPVSYEEVRRAIMAMQSFKAPGVDGFQAFFYKQYWHILGHDLHTMVADAFVASKGESSLLETFIVLIPKVENPLRFKDLRPISLCNVAYKVITKVLVNRFRPLLDELVGPLQGSFIPGRRTKDNIILAQEVMHTIHTYKRRGGLVALKIDLEKAYDRVSWDFLRATLYDFGFPPSIVDLIMWGVQSASISILWNGTKLESFTPQRGLRQGDPLSVILRNFQLSKALFVKEL
ncbi:uncharacterized protein LOC130725171 [Lotus japonicus]|uniref:uncharacterized protein LOC130725171 n=1 Tax=Lotus japonicus TaxID=34305 RepID=UPI0025879522|nr:uncharacterized protein LOC130725171 [Lotus japonicus]